jgi:quercetin 2,3-dioxygenase
MIKIYKAATRGSTKLDWLQSNHSFSFGNYYNTERMGFHSLRVINEDFVAPNKGFETHPHSNMEIISYVVEGELSHKDNMGNVETIKAGQFQLLSAGKGVTHSEFNPSPANPVHFLQIWILPKERNTIPRYEETQSYDKSKLGITLVASPTEITGKITLNQNVSIYIAHLLDQTEIFHDTTRAKANWIQVICGTVIISDTVSVNEITAKTGDGIAIERESTNNIESRIKFKALENSSFLIFDL